MGVVCSDGHARYLLWNAAGCRALLPAIQLYAGHREHARHDRFPPSMDIQSGSDANRSGGTGRCLRVISGAPDSDLDGAGRARGTLRCGQWCAFRESRDVSDA